MIRTRDPKKYFFSIFGTPAKDQPWGWRLEGHHISLNFAAVDNKLNHRRHLFLDLTLQSSVWKKKGRSSSQRRIGAGFALVNSFSSAQLQTCR
jgi:hypothetical protein